MKNTMTMISLLSTFVFSSAALAASSVKKGAYAILNCNQPLADVDPNSGELVPVLDINQKQVVSSVKLNISLDKVGQKSLEGVVLFPGFEHPNGEYIHSAQVEFKSLKVNQIRKFGPGMVGFDFDVQGTAITQVEGSTEKTKIKKVSLTLANGSDLGSLEVYSAKGHDILSTLILDNQCLPIKNFKLLSALADN
jgi:hypothetical protein